MDVSRLTQTQLEERWKWLLDDTDFTEVDVEYEIKSEIEINYIVDRKELVMDYQEYVATVEVEVMGVRHSISIPYLEEEYDEDTLYDMAMEIIEEQIIFMSSSIRPMTSEVFYE